MFVTVPFLTAYTLLPSSAAMSIPLWYSAFHNMGFVLAEHNEVSIPLSTGSIQPSGISAISVYVLAVTGQVRLLHRQKAGYRFCQIQYCLLPARKLLWIPSLFCLKIRLFLQAFLCCPSCCR